MDTHPAAWEIDSLLRDCRVERGRRGGPGGQHRNKVETAIDVTHEPTGIHASASERRSQEQNRKQAIWRLRVTLAIEHRLDSPVGPSALWQARTRGGKLSINPKHDDFPAVLAEAMDALAAYGWQPRSLTDRWHVTASQVIKLLKAEPRALERVNRHRAEENLPPLR